MEKSNTVVKNTDNSFMRYKSGGKAARPAIRSTMTPAGRNPYLNFLREFRRTHAGLSAVETVKRGAVEWKNLDKNKKLQYIEAVGDYLVFLNNFFMIIEN